MGLFRQITVAKERKLWSSFDYVEGEVDVPVDIIIPLLGENDNVYAMIYAAVDEIVIALLTETQALYEPVYEIVEEYGPIPLLTDTGTLWSPVYGPVTEITAILITDTGTLWDPVITITLVELIPPLLTNPSTLFDPYITEETGFDAWIGKRIYGYRFVETGVEYGLPTVDVDEVLTGSGGIGDVRVIESSRGADSVTTNTGPNTEDTQAFPLILETVDFGDSGVENPVVGVDIDYSKFNTNAPANENTPIYVADIIT
ncbi:hypothetical protein LCGC14_1405510 [marine sediment metagenome]|uniref:Uncharacterized protein n=1 Tax=marine sediment metagenome TaxID=412755 RepID=A0A0F9MB84_9ZZZZ